MTDTAVYQASPIKRHRATKADMQARHSALWKIVSAMKPMTIRQVYYQATVHNIVEKTEAGYNKVQNDLVQMRRNGSLPYAWLADSTRWQRKTESFDSVEQALQDTARFYRKSLWNDAPIATSKSGWRRTPWRAWSSPSPTCTTCR